MRDLESDEVVIVRMMELARKDGPILKLQFPQNALLILPGHDIIDMTQQQFRDGITTMNLLVDRLVRELREGTGQADFDVSLRTR